MRTTKLPFFKCAYVAATVLSIAAATYACVGDDPGASSSSSSSSSGGGDGGSSSGSPDGSSSSSSSSGGDGSTSDSGAVPRCDPTKPFEGADVVKGLSTPGDDLHVWVSSNELTAYVASGPLFSGTTIKKSVRNSINEDFPAPQVAPELNLVNDGGSYWVSPSLTADLNTIYVEHVGQSPQFLVFSRKSNADPFGSPEQPQTRGHEFYGKDPFIVPSSRSMLMVSPDAPSQVDEYGHDTKAIYGDGGVGDFETAASTRTEALVSDAGAYKPIIDEKGLILLFASDKKPATKQARDIWISTRAGDQGSFGAPVRLSNTVNGTSDDLPGSVSGDHCVLYFTSNRPGGFGGYDVYLAKRGK